MDDGCAPAAEVFAGERIRNDFRMPGEQRVDAASQIADAFAMNDSDLKNSPLPAFGQILVDHHLHIARPKCVQVQHAIDRQRDGFIRILLSICGSHAQK